jgi:hypothetical protein
MKNELSEWRKTMVKFLLFVCILIASIVASPLDTLISVGKTTELRLHRHHDNDNRKSNAKSTEDFDQTPTVITGVYLLNKINSLQVDLAKATVVLQSLQSQSTAHTDNSESNLRLIEILIGAFVTIMLAVIKLFIPSKKKKESSD